MKCFILKINRCFNVFVFDFPSCSVCSVLNCRFCSNIRQKQQPGVSAAEGSGLPKLQRSENATQLQPVEAHTFTRVIPISSAAMLEQSRTHICRNLGVKLLKQLKNMIILINLAKTVSWREHQKLYGGQIKGELL